MFRRSIVALLLPLALVACSPAADTDDAGNAENNQPQGMTDDNGGGTKDPAGMMGAVGDWPEDVPLYGGATVMFAGQSQEDDGGGMGLMLSSSASAKDIVDFYKTALVSKGWKLQNVMVSTVASGMEATKDGRHLVLGVTGDDGQSTITIGIENN